ncbi:C-type lectin domain family 2 member B-like [Pipra filicauda]|uniref:C-type lectin domain family 2 member B-like n=1 Tax=Pipra filicauda TaxID=649802 RepID=A0A7R5L385_9PASS|nr:C-type lectin domain family 2 member B-like [Pipra filicauda]
MWHQLLPWSHLFPRESSPVSSSSCWKKKPQGINPILLLFGAAHVSDSAFCVSVLSVRPQFSELEFSHVCPDTWPGFQGKCYHFSEAEGNWTTGRARCEALGASLATISTREELAFLLRYKGEANHWIGLGMGDNGWEWINGTALNGSFEVRGGGPCGYLNQGRISSSLCHTEKNWICSRPDNFVLWEGKLRDPKAGLSA